MSPSPSRPSAIVLAGSSGLEDCPRHYSTQTGRGGPALPRRSQHAPAFVARPCPQLEQLAHLIVPTLADWCCVDILHDDGQIHRLASSMPTPPSGPAEQLRQQYAILTPEAPHTLPVCARGSPGLIRRCRDPAAGRGPGWAHWDWSRPWVPGGNGCPTTARAGSGHDYLCARRGTRRYPCGIWLCRGTRPPCALAFDNARLYQERWWPGGAPAGPHRPGTAVAERTAASSTKWLSVSRLKPATTAATMLFQHEKLAAMGTIAGELAHELNNPLARHHDGG